MLQNAKKARCFVQSRISAYPTRNDTAETPNTQHPSPNNLRGLTFVIDAHPPPRTWISRPLLLPTRLSATLCISTADDCLRFRLLLLLRPTGIKLRYLC